MCFTFPVLMMLSSHLQTQRTAESLETRVFRSYVFTKILGLFENVYLARKPKKTCVAGLCGWEVRPWVCLPLS